MDCAPLNLAHFHERRADRFLQRHRYDDAFKAVETSLLYLQDAYKKVLIPRAIEVLDTQKWEMERKLRQIQMRKQQYERLKLKEIVPLSGTSSSLTIRPPDNSNTTAQSAAKSIDKTIRDFDAKFSSMIESQETLKENQDPRIVEKDSSESEAGTKNLQQHSTTANEQQNQQLHQKRQVHFDAEENDDMLSLAPLELPSFDFNVFTSSSPSPESAEEKAHNVQK